MIPGFSGCAINFKDGIVVKSATNYPSKRLQTQAQKQECFYKQQSYYRNIRIPKVYNQYYVESVFCFEMEYFNAIDIIQLIDSCGINIIQDIIEILLNFINVNINISSNINIDRQIIIDKYEQVKIDNSFDKKFYSLPKIINMPIGICHGDLTLSNILYNNKELILIDFLDSFIESPLIDIAKLRQDTKFGWSLLLYEKQYNDYRIWAILEYIDYWINKKFCWEISQVLEILNLLRIFPYCKNEKSKKYLRKIITYV